MNIENSQRLSAHISWKVPGAISTLVDTFVDNLRHWIHGEPLEGVVDLARGY